MIAMLVFEPRMGGQCVRTIFTVCAIHKYVFAREYGHDAQHLWQTWPKNQTAQNINFYFRNSLQEASSHLFQTSKRWSWHQNLAKFRIQWKFGHIASKLSQLIAFARFNSAQKFQLSQCIGNGSRRRCINEVETSAVDTEGEQLQNLVMTRSRIINHEQHSYSDQMLYRSCDVAAHDLWQGSGWHRREFGMGVRTIAEAIWIAAGPAASLPCLILWYSHHLQ